MIYMSTSVALCCGLRVRFISGSRRQWRSPISLYNYNYHVSSSLLPQRCVGGLQQTLFQPESVQACAPCQTSTHTVWALGVQQAADTGFTIRSSRLHASLGGETVCRHFDIEETLRRRRFILWNHPEHFCLKRSCWIYAIQFLNRKCILQSLAL